MKKLLILGLLLTSTAYAEGHDLQFEVEVEDLSSDNKLSRSFTEMKVLNIDYEYAVNRQFYLTGGLSTGSGYTNKISSNKWGTFREQSPHDYSGFRAGVGFRF